VRLARTKSREVFVPLAHPPGHAQVDFGECIGMPQSNACFLKAYPAETDNQQRRWPGRQIQKLCSKRLRRPMLRRKRSGAAQVAPSRELLEPRVVLGRLLPSRTGAGLIIATAASA
jgi:hypothetical protein